MTQDHPASNAGPRIPRQRRPTPTETDPKEEDAATPPVHPTPPKKKPKTKTDLAIDEAASRLAANAPPLSPEQRRRIAELFSTVVNNRHR